MKATQMTPNLTRNILTLALTPTLTLPYRTLTLT